MPRTKRGDGGDAAAAVAAGTSDKGAIACGSVDAEAHADAESEGGPEHLVSFDSLMSWPDVQVSFDEVDDVGVRALLGVHCICVCVCVVEGGVGGVGWCVLVFLALLYSTRCMYYLSSGGLN